MDAVIVVFESTYLLSINWIGNAMNDTIADAVLAIILAAESSPVSLQAEELVTPHATVLRSEKLDRVLLFLKAQFGDAVTSVSDGVEIRVDTIESHMAKLDFDTMEIECKWEPLDSRVKHIVKRALGVVAPLGIGGELEDEDMIAEIENLVEADVKIENGGVRVDEDDYTMYNE